MLVTQVLGGYSVCRKVTTKTDSQINGPPQWGDLVSTVIHMLKLRPDSTGTSLLKHDFIGTVGCVKNSNRFYFTSINQSSVLIRWAGPA